MNRSSPTKKLTLRKETLRRLTRELTEQQLAKVFGGSDADRGPNQVKTNTNFETIISYWIQC